MSVYKSIASLLAITLAVSTANANIVIEVTQPSVLPGYTAYGIYWEGGGVTDWNSALLNVQLTQGTFYQNSNGGDGAPASVFIGFVPTLEFDTYFGIIDDSTGALLGGCAAIGCPPYVTDDLILYGWANYSPDDTGYVKIGNFTVPNDAIGTWWIQSAGAIYEGIIPEPATLALFGLAVPALLRRR